MHFAVELASVNDNNSFLVLPMGRINKHGQIVKEKNSQG